MVTLPCGPGRLHTPSATTAPSFTASENLLHIEPLICAPIWYIALSVASSRHTFMVCDWPPAMPICISHRPALRLGRLAGSSTAAAEAARHSRDSANNERTSTGRERVDMGFSPEPRWWPGGPLAAH